MAALLRRLFVGQDIRDANGAIASLKGQVGTTGQASLKPADGQAGTFSKNTFWRAKPKCLGVGEGDQILIPGLPEVIGEFRQSEIGLGAILILYLGLDYKEWNGILPW